MSASSRRRCAIWRRLPDGFNALISLAVYVIVVGLYFRVIRICIEGETLIAIFITVMMVMTGLTISEFAFTALSGTGRLTRCKRRLAAPDQAASSSSVIGKQGIEIEIAYHLLVDRDDGLGQRPFCGRQHIGSRLQFGSG
jgi:hypothetical protein